MYDSFELRTNIQFYTAPTAIRLLNKHGDDHVKRYSRSSLKVLGTVGEPINPEAWRWYHEVVGDRRCGRSQDLDVLMMKILSIPGGRQKQVAL